MTQFSVFRLPSDTLPDRRKTSALRAFVTGSGRLRHTAFLLLLFRVLGKGSKCVEICHGYTRRYSRPHSLLLPYSGQSLTHGSHLSLPLKAGYTLDLGCRSAHSGSQGQTRRVSDGGGISTLGAVHVFRNLCARRCQGGILCRFALPCHLTADDENLRRISNKFGAYKTGMVSLPSVRASCSGNPARAGVRAAYFAVFAWDCGYARNKAGRLRNRDAFSHGLRCSAADFYTAGELRGFASSALKCRE